MKWWPGTIRYGDVLRVRVGQIRHYGIAVGEDQVVQFGLPPRRGVTLTPDELRVLVSNTEAFSAGNIVEVGQPEASDKRLLYSREQTAARALARVGEDGYHILHNNCEHFVWECAMGVHRCEQTELPYCRVYLCRMPESDESPGSLPEAAGRDIARIRDPLMKKRRIGCLRLLEAALADTLGCRLEYARLDVNCFGTYSCEAARISLDAAGDWCLAAVSSRPVGAVLSVTGEGQNTTPSPETALKRAARQARKEKKLRTGSFGFRKIPEIIVGLAAAEGLKTGWYLKDASGLRFLRENEDFYQK